MPENDSYSHPRLRALEAFPVQTNGQVLLCLRDPQGFVEQPIFLNQTLVFLVSRMDGAHSLRDIQTDYFQATGEILPTEELENLIKQLDEQRFLDSPAFSSYHQSLVQEFKSSLYRRAHHAGLAYAEEYEELAAQIQGFFAHPEGPGHPMSPDSSEPLRGLIAPHIDFTRGGPTYAHAYKALAEHPGADTFVIFGTCHSPMRQRFSLTDKDYETPLGAARNDKDFVARLLTRLEGQYADEFPHRAEHSIEFQAVCLKYILGNRQDFRIVPVLVGSFDDIYSEGRTAEQDPEIQKVVKAVRDTIRETKGRVCIIAGADLAHVGRQFGDDSGPTEYSLRDVERDDRSFLDLAAAGDAEGLFQSIAADKDRRRVCGYPPIYMALRCLDQPRGKLLQYRQWSDLNAGAAVTFAAMAIY